MDTDEYQRLCLKIEQAQREADHYERQRDMLAQCFGQLIEQAIQAKGLSPADCPALLAGTHHACLGGYLRFAGFKMTPLMRQCCDLLVTGLP